MNDVAQRRALVLAGSALLAASFPCFTARGAPVIYAGAALLALGNGLMSRPDEAARVRALANRWPGVHLGPTHP